MALTPFLNPCTMSVVGVTGAGKTSFVRRLLRYRDDVFDSKFTSIHYFYTMWQDVYGEMQKEFGSVISFSEGLPEPEQVTNIGKSSGYKCLILDDLMSAVSKDKTMEDLFTKYSNHYKISVIYITQNSFAQGKASRGIAVNVHYTVLMANPRVSQITALGNQFGFGQALKEAFIDATAKKRFAYLIVLASPRDETGYQMVSRVLPDESELATLYVPV